MKNALHFVGFKVGTEQYELAARMFGVPDFIHPGWDRRALAEIIDGDVAIFAQGSIGIEPRAFAYHEEER